MSLGEQLQLLGTCIQDMCKATGNAGLAVGVMKEGQVLHQSFYGVQCSLTDKRPDGQTIFHTGSLTKALTAAGLAILVDEGKLSWNSRLVDILPGFHQCNKDVESQATLTDLLAHRMGLAMRMNYWAQMEQELLVSADVAIDVLGALNKTADFRTTIKYNNWTYSVAGQIIERYCEMSLEDFMRTHFFDPLGLSRTTFGKVTNDNYASCHITLSDGRPFKVPRPNIRSGAVLAGAAGLTSCLDDLLRLYNAWLYALEDQKRTGLTSTPGSPFKQAVSTFTPHNKKCTTEYGLGWFLTELPAEIGWIGINDGRVKQNPIIARGTKPTPVAYHNGSMPGVLSSVHLIPSQNITIVILANTLAFADIPDYVGGLILENILGAPQHTDFIPLIEEAKEVSIHAPMETVKKLAADRKSGTTHGPLEEYEGQFINKEEIFFLDVMRHGEGLRMHVQGQPKTYYNLHHYCDDVFAWTCDRDAEAMRAMFPQLSVAFRKVCFQRDADGKVVSILWVYARDEPDGEVFWKSASSKPLNVASIQ